MSAQPEEPPAKRQKEAPADAANVPITLLSGFLGAGKTTLLKHLLENKQGLKVGVVVNDVAEVNIDAALIQGKGGLPGEVAEDTIELQNGCACCSSAEELLQSVEKLMQLAEKRQSAWDHLVIEMSGVGEPREVRDNFRSCFQSQPEYLAGTMLHTMVTVVDGSTFLAEFEKRNKVDQRPDLGTSDLTDGNRQVVDLMCEQIECADVLIVNKMDLVRSPEEAALLRETVATLNQGADVITSERGRVELSKVLGAAGPNGICMMDEDDEHRAMIVKAKSVEVEAHAHEHQESHGHGHEEGNGSSHEHGHSSEHGHEEDDCDVCTDGKEPSGHEHSHSKSGTTNVRHERFGIGSFVYQRRRPFHPHRLMAVIRQLPVRQEELALSEALKKDEGSASKDAASKAEVSPMASLIRSKGFIWLSNSHSQMFYWALAGKHFELKQYATWWDSLPRDEWPADEKEVSNIMKEFEGDAGDRRQELVFIGVKVDRQAIVKLLDGCLLSDAEMASYKQHWLS